jgi:Ca2+-binding EF-hand superfamily protein
MSVEEIRLRLLKNNRQHRKSSYPLITDLFKKMDKDHSREIEYHEFKDGLHYLGMKNIQEKEMHQLFNKFDTDKKGKVDFEAFVTALRPPLPESRLRIINEAFDKLDINKDGVLSVEDFRVVYKDQANSHAKFKCGEWTIDQVLIKPIIQCLAKIYKLYMNLGAQKLFGCI